MKQRFLAALLSLSLAISLAACTPTGPSPAAGTPPPTAVTDEFKPGT